MARTVILIVALLVGVSGQAATWYGELALGAGFAENISLNESGAAAEFDFGAPIASAVIGRYLGDRWRLEIEAGFRDNDLETFTWPDADTPLRLDANDGVRAVNFSFNAIREFRIGALEPYLGAGVGPAELRFRMSEGAFGFTNRVPRRPILDDETWSPAVQLIAGFGVPVARRWALTFDYRYWHATSVKLTGEGGEDYDLTHTVHSANARVRYLFNGSTDHPSSTRPSPMNGRWYLGAAFGAGYAMDAEIDDSTENIDAFRVGPFYSAVLGRALGSRWRAEIELAYRRNLVEVIDFGPPAGQFAATGEVEAASLMANLLYAFSPGTPIRPFLGGGVGAARVRHQITTRDQPYVDDAATAPAVQFLMGFHIALTPRLDFRGDYRFWYSYPIKLERENGDPLQTTHWVHTATLGFHYAL